MQKNQQLVEENIKLVYFVLHKYYPTYVKDEDIVQSGMLGLCNAADTWDESKSEFSTYATKCISNEIGKEFRRRNKHSNVISLDQEIRYQEYDGVTLADCITGEEEIDFIDCEPFYNQLSPKDKQIVDYRQQGLTTVEIGEKMGCAQSTVSTRLRNLRTLWRTLNGN